MPLGELLLAKNLLDKEQLETALEHQRVAGGLFGDNLVTLGFITRDKLNEIILEPPPVPQSIGDTGMDTPFLVNLVLKAIYVSGFETAPEISDQIKLSRGIVEELLNIAKKNGLLEVRGATESNFTVLRYALTSIGREQALEAFRSCQYIGPVPVPLANYQFQVQKQAVTNERIHAEVISQALFHLILPEETLRRLGPAINSGKAILLYGPSGNGKTSIAEAIGETFQQPIYIPYCIEVDGQIIKIFDPAVHREIASQPDSENNDTSPFYLRAVPFDPRWVQCRRPVIISGGELTLEMLDLEFDSFTKYYEAPLQVKATGGVFAIDDFGRQLVRPQDLLNRWIIPLEKKVDYLTLHTGKKFELPFDQLIIFSTNIPPEELMDTAFLRRIHYKLLIDPPTVEDYKAIFRRICSFHKLELSEEILSYILSSFYHKNNTPLAAFHPKFIVEHAIAACSYDGTPPQLTLELVKDALGNLVISQPSSTLGSKNHG
ncbi:MAG: ATPase [Deltaproteobacteria bacterium]|nr:ATPase [Deltaproteobacteria bacterium]